MQRERNEESYTTVPSAFYFHEKFGYVRNSEKISVVDIHALGLYSQAILSLANTKTFLALLENSNLSTDLIRQAKQILALLENNEHVEDKIKHLFQILGPGSRDKLTAYLAGERVSKKIIQEIGQIISVVQNQSDIFEQNEEGRFMLRQEGEFQSSRIFDELEIKGNVPSFAVPVDTRYESYETQAGLVTDFLIGLTRRHTFEAQISEKAINDLKDKILSRLASEQELRLCIYISTEKFANPLDTKDSHIDLGELQIAFELEAVIRTIETITGMRPQILLMNESPANAAYTNSNYVEFLDEFKTLLNALNIGDAVSIRDFDSSFFWNYLMKQNISLEEAQALFENLHKIFVEAYRAMHAKKVTQENIWEYLTPLIEDTLLVSPESTKVIEGLIEYIASNFEQIANKEILQVINSETSMVDPSLLFPIMSANLWSLALKRTDTSNLQSREVLEIEGKLKKLVVQQAALQGFSFKALMRMRYVMKNIFGKPVVPADYIAASITNAEEKISIPMGRFKKTRIIISDNEVEGVTPMHGMGVIVKDRIVSIPWQEIANNPELFQPASVTIGNVIVNGYAYKGEN